jgi:hypothetical protein
VRGTGWSIDALALRIPTLAPAQRVSARASGRYRSGTLQLPFALAATLSAPTPDAAIGVAGDITIDRNDWRIPARLVLSGRLRSSSGGLRLERAILSAAARYEAGQTRAGFDLGAAGTLRFAPVRRLAPAAISLRGSGLVPTLDASGTITVADSLDIDLAGRLARWPRGWPQLPPPMGQSASPLPFRLRYAGDTGMTGIVELGMHLDDSAFDGRFRIADVGTWIDAPGGSPIPPLDARITSPRIDIAGAQLQGVDMTLDDQDVEAAAPRARP